MKIPVLVAGVALVVCVGGDADAAVIADSVTEFSCVQGQDNWRYGYYDGPFSSADFQEMTQCIPHPSPGATSWWVDPMNYWTSIRSEVSFPNGPASCGRLPVEQWAVRRWVSEATGTIAITGVVQNVLGGFDGFTAHIIVNGTLVWSQPVAGTNPITYTQHVTVAPGSVVDFAVQPGASDCNDHAKFTAIITAGPLCDIELNQTSFVDGQTAIAQVFRIANTSAPSVAVEFKFWIEVPGLGPVSFLRGGADGSVVLPPGFDVNLGPFPLFMLTPAFPRGDWSFGCRMLSPVTGAHVHEEINPFTVE
jgi:hypothetical protein